MALPNLTLSSLCYFKQEYFTPSSSPSSFSFIASINWSNSHLISNQRFWDNPVWATRDRHKLKVFKFWQNFQHIFDNCLSRWLEHVYFSFRDFLSLSLSLFLAQSRTTNLQVRRSSKNCLATIVCNFRLNKVFRATCLPIPVVNLDVRTWHT